LTLEGKVATLITGGPSGLGKGAARESQELGPKARFLHCDVTTAVDATVVWRRRLDVMHNSASVLGPAVPGHVVDRQPRPGAVRCRHVRERAWDVDGHIKHATCVMAPPVGGRAGAGSIPCMTSISCVLVGLGMYSYAVSKFAGCRGDHHGRRRSRHSICANCISPCAAPMPTVVGQSSVLLADGADEAHVETVIRGLGATCEAVDMGAYLSPTASTETCPCFLCHPLPPLAHLASLERHHDASAATGIPPPPPPSTPPPVNPALLE
ncbi:hypothetical protein U9M48_002658, partial [Paspalum notatum var. saurae]